MGSIWYLVSVVWSFSRMRSNFVILYVLQASVYFQINVEIVSSWRIILYLGAYISYFTFITHKYRYFKRETWLWNSPFESSISSNWCTFKCGELSSREVFSSYFNQIKRYNTIKHMKKTDMHEIIMIKNRNNFFTYLCFKTHCK